MLRISRDDIILKELDKDDIKEIKTKEDWKKIMIEVALSSGVPKIQNIEFEYYFDKIDFEEGELPNIGMVDYYKRHVYEYKDETNTIRLYNKVNLVNDLEEDTDTEMIIEFKAENIKEALSGRNIKDSIDKNNKTRKRVENHEINEVDMEKQMLPKYAHGQKYKYCYQEPLEIFLSENSSDNVFRFFYKIDGREIHVTFDPNGGKLGSGKDIDNYIIPLYMDIDDNDFQLIPDNKIENYENSSASKSGYIFKGWNTNKDYKINLEDDEEKQEGKWMEDIILDENSKDLKLFAIWEKRESTGGGGSGGGGGEIPSLPPGEEKPEEIPEKKPEEEKESEEHFSYMHGYPEGDFRPGNNMLRAEVAQVFSRLLVESLEIPKGNIGQYPDVKKSDWYSDAVGYLDKKNLIEGYPEGKFRPISNITRAEFVTIMKRFGNPESGNQTFGDIKGHWGQKHIEDVTSAGWIIGYPDGDFRPDDFITREEAVTAINRMLNRNGDKKYILDNRDLMIDYTDVKESRWSFTDIYEASVYHYFDRDKDEIKEIWNGIQ